jgi:hypothetical protein
MAMCPQCEGEMMDEISCLSEPIPIGGDFFEPIRWGDERGSSRWVIDFPCRDCRTPIGGVHHPGCRVERCPACLGQALGCPCFGDPDDDLDDLDDLDDRDDADDAGDECTRLELASRHAGVDAGDDSKDDFDAHVRISTRCRAHLFHRYFRR